MKAMAIDTFGSPAELRLVEMAKPQVKSGHVLIEVKATSVNPVDCRIRRGDAMGMAPSLPAVLQGDVAGVIVEIGAGVKDFQIGDEVYALAGGTKNCAGGALSEYMLADSRFLAMKPKTLTMKESAALPLVSLTAWQGLVERTEVKESQKVLIHGAAGGVGHIAVQIAKWLGAEVYGTVSGEKKANYVKSLGATVIDYQTEKVSDYVERYTNRKGFDVVFDTVGGENLEKSFQATAPLGQIIAISTWGKYDLSLLNAKGLNLRVVFCMYPLVSGQNREHYGEILTKVRELVDNGVIVPLLDSHDFSISDAAKAHELLESGQHFGKIVLENK